MNSRKLQNPRLQAYGWPKISDSKSIRIFPPPPNDDRGWAEVIQSNPEVKPTICELDDELASVLEHRRDALRLLGNGVVPVQAAYAFIKLAERF